MFKMSQMRKRGANYTQEEKALLLDLVMQFKYIVECKRTGGIFIQKKKEAWNAITIKYNSNCTSGTRDTEQLKSLYDNMKQKSRKDLGESNILAYINNNSEQRETSQLNVTTLGTDLAHALEMVKQDKIEINKTGGGFWKPKLTDNDAKVLAIIQDQVQPLCNPHDSASIFFKDAITCTVETNNATQTYASPSCSLTKEAEKQKPGENIIVEVLHTPPTLKCITETPTAKKAMKRKIASKISRPTSAEFLKHLYFKKKCQNADLEKKKLMMEILFKKREHNLKMTIMKNELKNKT